MGTIANKLISSMEKCFGDSAVASFSEFSAARAVRGERFSFQWVFRSETPLDAKEVCYFRAESVLGDAVSAQRVELIPIRMPYYELRHDDNYLRGEMGLYPDLLMPISEKTQVYVTSRVTHALWIDIDIPADAPAGVCPIRLSMVNDRGEERFSAVFELHIVAAILPKQTLQHTEWFHADCLADYYRIPVWSEEHWRIVENFVRAAVRGGVNMLLTPIFTPALDTAVGGERTTCQLIDISCDAGVWSFDFAKLGRWIDMAQRQGIEYLEMAHLYTQWGAGHAPKIMATVDGVYKKVFGWETDSLSDEYRTFLDAFLPALTQYLRDRGIADKCVFHISDEPSAAHEAHYRAAVEAVRPYLSECVIADALSDYRYYESGLVKTPIAALNHVDAFAGRCDDLWVYYTGGPYMKNCSNRLISNTPARTRVLGVQMYVLGAKGFLHWGYNYYYDRMSQGLFDPFADPCAYKQMPGSTYLAYPGRDGHALPSIREKLMAEAFYDLDALRLLETKIGRDAVLALCREVLGEDVTPTVIPAGDALSDLRAAVNRALADGMER